MKYRYSRFKSGILYCALQEKHLPAGAEKFRARSGPQGAGVAKDLGLFGSLVRGPILRNFNKKIAEKNTKSRS
jgi:hypothetical protein